MIESGRIFSETEIISWAMQLSSALAYLERKKIVHHDLKPANILFDGDSVKIGDFGLSKVIES